MNRLQINHVKRLHRTVMAGESAKVERDKLLTELNEEGISQVELAAICDSAVPDSMSRNAMQKLIQRQKKVEE